MAFKDLTGMKFHKLYVKSRASNNKHQKARWTCICDCGKEAVIVGSSLMNGRTKSCGCFNIEKNRIIHLKHGYDKANTDGVSKIYTAWANVIQRCTNIRRKDYQYYGGRGIKVCDRWLKFENFLEDMGNPPTKKHSVDRIDNNGNYCKENCRWATKKEQSRNQRDNRLITFNDKTKCLAEWVEEFNIQYYTLKKRINMGWDIKKAFYEPIKNIKKGK